MTKKPPFSGPSKTPTFAPQGGSRPTVGLPRAAFGGGAPTVGIPGGGQAGGFRPGAAGSRPGGQPAAEDLVRLLQLGGAHLAAGRLDHAGRAAAHVLKVDPKNPDALHLLGLVALGKGDAANAEKLIAAAAAMMPHHVNVWVNLGNAQRDQGKTDEALITYAQALAVDPNYAEVYLQRGILYKSNSALTEAAVDFDKLIELRGDEPAPYLRAAETAANRGQYKTAIKYCETALEKLSPAPVAILVFLASTHEMLSNLDQAISIAERALEIEPMNLSAFHMLTKAKRRMYKGKKDVLAQLRQQLESLEFSSMAPGDARLFYSELAQLCDALGDLPAAFNYFRLQNEKTSELSMLEKRDLGKFMRDVGTLIDITTADSIKSWRTLAPRNIEPCHKAAPVFLVGFPRSGTTLLDQILDAHPDVQVFEELPLLRSVRLSLDDYPRSLATMNEEERERARQVYWASLRKEGADLEGKTVVNKMPLDMIHAGLIHRVFPEARILFALRHPADCVLSCFMQDFVPNGAMVNFLTLDGSARFYDQVMTLWVKYRALLPLNVHEVRYERLIADLRGEVGSALEFLELPWHEAVSDPATHALARGTIRTPSYSQVTQPIYSTAADRWRRYEKHMQPVMPLLEAHIKRFGYPV